ncbi:MAG: hypothetical protein ACE5JL_09475, partial [Dehalococcoidia bacterium]
GGDLSLIPAGALKVPLVHVNSTFEEKLPPPTCPASGISAVSLLDPETIEEKVAQQPGTYWYLGGETNVPAQDGLCATVYAEVFHYYWQEIKAADPTAKVMSASVLNWDIPCTFVVPGDCGVQPGESWVQEFIDAYVSKYGSQPPVDVWLIDAYPLDWRNTWNGTFFQFSSPAAGIPTGMTNHQFIINQIVGMRQFLDGIPEQKDKPIWITEMGTHSGWDGYTFPCSISGTLGVDCEGEVVGLIQPAGEYHWDWLEQYLTNLLDWLETNSEAMNIERWFFFTTYRDVTSPSPEGFGGTIMFDGPGVGANLTTLGTLYRDRALD